MATILQPHRENVRRVADLLCAGEVVALPTETVYGLAADATDEAAVAKIFAAKGRPATNPLIVHVSEAAMAEDFADTRLPQWAGLTRAFWPGPLTLVLPRRGKRIASAVTAGLQTLAVRMPAKELALEVIAAASRPLAAPSANPSGYTSPTRAEHVNASMGSRIAYILDGGPCERGIESTVLSLLDPGRPRILRPGPITRAMLEEVLDGEVSGAGETAGLPEQPQVAPGQFFAHYQPHTPVLLFSDVQQLDRTEEGVSAVVIHRPADLPEFKQFAECVLLGGGDPAEAERSFYATLLRLDAAGYQQIFFHLPERPALPEGLLDRVMRASRGWARQ